MIIIRRLPLPLGVFGWCEVLQWRDWRASLCRLAFNGAGVLADSCVCARCHGFQLKDGGVGKDEVLPYFQPPSDPLLWTNTCTLPSSCILVCVIGFVFRRECFQPPMWSPQLMADAPSPLMNPSLL